MMSHRKPGVCFRPINVQSHRNIWFDFKSKGNTAFYFCVHIFSLCHQHAHILTLHRKHLVPLTYIAMNFFWMLCIQPKLLTMMSLLHLLEESYFFTFLHKLPPPLHRLRRWCAYQLLTVLSDSKQKSNVGLLHSSA